MSSTSAMLRAGPSPRAIFTSRVSGAVAASVAVGAAQVHVRQELHLDVLEAVARAGRAAAVARVEAERAERVAALDRHGSAAKRLRITSKAPT